MLVFLVVIAVLIICGFALASGAEWQRVFFRAWIALSALWAGIVVFMAQGGHPPPAEAFWVAAGPPAALFALGVVLRWIFSGFRVS